MRWKRPFGRRRGVGWRKSSPGRGGLSVLYISYGAFWADLFPNKTREIKSPYLTLGETGLSQRMRTVTANEWDARRYERRGLCKAASPACSRCLRGEPWYLSHSTDVGNAAQDKSGWCCVFQCSWVKRQTTYIWVTLPRPHRHTGTNTHTGWTFGPPAEETCLTQSCKCLFLPLLWNDSVSIGGFEGAEPCLEDNLVRTIWSRFHYSFLWFFFSLPKEIKHFFFSVLILSRNVTWI